MMQAARLQMTASAPVILQNMKLAPAIKPLTPIGHLEPLSHASVRAKIQMRNAPRFLTHHPKGMIISLTHKHLTNAFVSTLQHIAPKERKTMTEHADRMTAWRRKALAGHATPRIVRVKKPPTCGSASAPACIASCPEAKKTCQVVRGSTGDANPRLASTPDSCACLCNKQARDACKAPDKWDENACACTHVPLTCENSAPMCGGPCPDNGRCMGFSTLDQKDVCKCEPEIKKTLCSKGVKPANGGTAGQNLPSVENKRCVQIPFLGYVNFFSCSDKYSCWTNGQCTLVAQALAIQNGWTTGDTTIPGSGGTELTSCTNDCPAGSTCMPGCYCEPPTYKTCNGADSTDSAKACFDDCPADQTCVVNGPNDCSCKPKPTVLTCNGVSSTDPAKACYNDCPSGQQCRVNGPNDCSCIIIVPQTCAWQGGASGSGICTGQCPPGMICPSATSAADCLCKPAKPQVAPITIQPPSTPTKVGQVATFSVSATTSGPLTVSFGGQSKVIPGAGTFRITCNIAGTQSGIVTSATSSAPFVLMCAR